MIQNIENYSQESKYNVLCDLLLKGMVEIEYGGELPSGVIPPVSIIGTVTFVGTKNFTFQPQFPKTPEEEEMSLEIEKVIAFDILGYIPPNCKRKVSRID